jgi:hypothetical protein
LHNILNGILYLYIFKILTFKYILYLYYMKETIPELHHIISKS